MKEGWRERKRESKCVHRKKAKRLQKSNSLTSVWDAVVASEGQRGKINTSWFAEGGRVGGGGGGEPERWEKRPTAQIKIKRNPDYTEEGKMFLYVGFTHWCLSERVVYWWGRRVFLGLPGGGARGGLTCRGEQTRREQPVNAVRKQTRAVLHRHAERTLGRTTRPRTGEKKNRQHGFYWHEIFLSSK